MFVNGKFFGYTMEDVVRDLSKEQKVMHKTAIPAGQYSVVVNMSNHFKREMCQILNVPQFEGIRIHGGNTAEDTSGCILVAKNYDPKIPAIQGSLEKEITAIVKADKNPSTITVLDVQ